MKPFRSAKWWTFISQWSNFHFPIFLLPIPQVLCYHYIILTSLPSLLLHYNHVIITHYYNYIYCKFIIISLLHHYYIIITMEIHVKMIQLLHVMQRGKLPLLHYHYPSLYHYYNGVYYNQLLHISVSLISDDVHDVLDVHQVKNARKKYFLSNISSDMICGVHCQTLKYVKI